MKTDVFLLLTVMLLITSIPLPVHVPEVRAIPGNTRADETWTIFSYISGDGNLEKDLIGDLNEMERVGSTADARIVVQIDRSTGYYSGNGDWSDTRRYLVQKDETDSIASLRLDDPPLGELNMDDPWSLKQFLVWGFNNYPADHYMIALEGHANGPATGLMKDDSSTLGGSRQMSTDEMGWAVRSAIDETIGRPVDLISFDVCWMGMVEAAAEIMDHADYMIGSFDLIPGAGWPYDECLPLIINDSLPLERRLEKVVDTFIDGYSSRYSYVSLSAIDLDAFRNELVPALENLSVELFYSVYDERSLYDSLIRSVDKPSNKDGIVSNDRYIDLYQFCQYLLMDPGTPIRVRSTAGSVMDAEDSVIVHRKAGANHPPDSRLLGIYMPANMDDPDYENLRIAELTAWDDMVRLYVRGMDARPVALNWTGERPGSLSFSLGTSTPELIFRVIVQTISEGVSDNLTLIGAGNVFSGSLTPAEVNEFRYRYRVQSIYGGIVDFPPDGFKLERFQSETFPPEVWHEPPPVVDITSSSGGLTFFIRDDTGIDTLSPEKIPRLEYREIGKESWYSRPLAQGKKNMFTGWREYSEAPSGVSPGARFEYHVVVTDVLGNSATCPPSGEWNSVMGVGARFFLDAARSDTTDHGALVKEFMELGMAVDARVDGDSLSELSGYKGYILIMPDGIMRPEDADRIGEFIDSGGEFLLIMDPDDQLQADYIQPLMDKLNISPTQKGSVNGFFPANPVSELGRNLPSITGTSTGSFILSGGQTAVYYSETPFASMYTGWYGKGRLVVSVPIILVDEMMERSANLQLADMVIGYLQENMRPVVEINVDPQGVVVPGQEVKFNLSGSHDRDGDVVEYSISMSDSTFIEGPGPVFHYNFTRTGVFSILVKAYDEEGGVGITTISIRVNRPPSTDFGISSTVVHAGDEVTFSYKGSDPDGDEIMVEWDFGDGVRRSGLLVRHSYRQRGEITFTVTVRDQWGLVGIRSGKITVENSMPEALIDRDNILVNGAAANFSGELKITLYIREGDMVRFPGDTSSDPDQNDVLNFTWDMGDGTLLYDAVAVHRFLVSGLLRVNLTVDDGHGGSDTTDIFVNVANTPPFAAFTSMDRDGKILFDASLSTDDPWDMDGLQYRWDFGDGRKEVTSSDSIGHDYTFGGRYRVRLTVVDGDGDEGSFESEVVVGGMTASVLSTLIISSFVIVLVIALLLWRRLKAKMIRDDVGLLEILKIKPYRETEERVPSGFGRPVRSGHPTSQEGRIRGFGMGGETERTGTEQSNRPRPFLPEGRKRRGE